MYPRWGGGHHSFKAALSLDVLVSRGRAADFNQGAFVTCRELADFILDYLDGGLAAEERARFEGHLSRCPNCRRYVAAYETTVSLGRRAFDDEKATAETTGAPEDLIKAILAARAR